MIGNVFKWIKMFLINYQRKLIKKLNLKSNIFVDNSSTLSL